MLNIKRNILFIGILLFIFTLTFVDFGYSVDNDIVFYKIKKFGAKIGSSQLEFKGVTEYNGKQYELIVFTARSFNFFDEEKIYLDLSSLYPAVVVRDLNIFGKKERIVETYGEDGVVNILKKTKAKETTVVLRKNGQVDNVYSFIYRLRAAKNIQVGDKFELNLPTKNVEACVSGKVKIKVAGKLMYAYYIETIPKQFKIWLSADDKLLPLRIDGAVGLNRASMIMSKRLMMGDQ